MPANPAPIMAENARYAFKSAPPKRISKWTPFVEGLQTRKALVLFSTAQQTFVGAKLKFKKKRFFEQSRIWLKPFV